MTYEELVSIMETEGVYKSFIYKGLKCEIKRHPSLKYLCGYLTLPLGYVDADSIPCHGGVTSNKETDDGIEIGFDCGHTSDVSPEMVKMGFGGVSSAEYRTMDYCEKELRDMVAYVYSNLSEQDVRIKLVLRRLKND